MSRYNSQYGHHQHIKQYHHYTPLITCHSTDWLFMFMAVGGADIS